MREYVHSACSAAQAAGPRIQTMLELMTKVPRIKAIHAGIGGLINIARNPDGNAHMVGSRYLDSSEYDWTNDKTCLIHRPMSRDAYIEMRESSRPW